MTPRRPGAAVLSLVGLLAIGLGACHRAAPSRGAGLRKIDVHTHVGPDAVDHLVALMDERGIAVAINLSGGSPGKGLELQLAAAARHPGRIIVFTTLDWSLAQAGPGYGARMAAELEQAYALGARGLKIPKGLGLGYTDSAGHLIAVDDPELDPVFAKAGELGLPVAIHTGDPVAFWQAPDARNERRAELVAHPAWSLYRRPVPSWEALFAALERRIARHPHTTFISVHFGNAAEYPERVAALLDRYPNLYVDTAARIPELGRHDPTAMRALVLGHADRILFGTDLGVGRGHADLMLGSSGPAPPTDAEIDRFFVSTWRYFETADRNFPSPTAIQGAWSVSGLELPRDALAAIYGGNAARLLGLPPSP